jgi:hypothetical protein
LSAAVFELVRATATAPYSAFELSVTVIVALPPDVTDAGLTATALTVGAGTIAATSDVDALPATAVKPGPSTICVAAASVTAALLASATDVQFACETVPVQFVTVEAAA